MCQKLYNAMTDILSMGYFKNCAAKSGSKSFGHEDAITEKFITAGFQLLNNKNFPRLTKGLLREWEETDLSPTFLTDKSDTKFKSKANISFGEMPLGSFLQQPAGPQSFPDFLLRDFNGRFIAIEAKSSSKGLTQRQHKDAAVKAPMWNDNLPKLGALYILSNEVVNETTVFLGKDVINKEIIELRKQLTAEYDRINLIFKQKVCAADIKQRGWDIKCRQQNFQGGGSTKVDYFKHVSREVCEKNALGFAAG